jgi:hypothetical protein
MFAQIAAQVAIDVLRSRQASIARVGVLVDPLDQLAHSRAR